MLGNDLLQVLALRDVHTEGFFAEDMEAGFERGLNLLAVKA